MPTYARACTACAHDFEVHTLIAHRNDPEPCPECGSPSERTWRPGGAPKTGVFPYYHPHLTGEGPVVVESLSHLRALERKFGVVATAFSQHTSNQIDSPRDLPRHRPGGREYGDR